MRQVVALTATIGALRASAASGKLVLDHAAGENILSMLTEQMDRVDNWLERSHGLARRAPFGQNPVGQAMAAKFESSAGGDHDVSLAGVLTPYRRVLEEAHDAVREAMKVYRRAEDEHVATFEKLAR